MLEVSEAVAFLFLAFLSFVAEDAVTPRQRISNNGVQHRCRIRRVIELHFMDSISRRRSSAHVRLAPFKLEGDPDNSSGHLYTWGLTTGEESGQNNQADNIPARHKLISLAFARLLTVADTITIASNSVNRDDLVAKDISHGLDSSEHDHSRLPHPAAWTAASSQSHKPGIVPIRRSVAGHAQAK